MKADELLEKALPLYAVADGRRVRKMIDAVRDALPDLNNYRVWRLALDALTEATKSKGVINGFQSWECQEGRTIEECRRAMRRAIPIAKKNERLEYEEMQAQYFCH